MKLAYFVHDLLDPAVARRVRMLTAGGAEPVILGFRRGDAAPATISGVAAIDLGRTFDSRLGHRALQTVAAAVSAGRWRRLLAETEVIMARSLEMLTVAAVARRACGLKVDLVYECLDIHRVMLGDGRKSRLLRAAERALMRRSSQLIVSSPAFVDAYFSPMQGVGTDLPIKTLLVENKVLELEPGPRAPAGRPAGPAWRIGWMGAIRCRRSLDLLRELAARRPDLVEVRIHGRPAYSEFENFDAQVTGADGVAFLGPYRPDDLAKLYGDVHFSWAIDFMEEGLNSSWLLPNRVYESGRYGAVPLTLADVQTGRFVAERGFGVGLSDVADLEAFLDGLTPEAYRALVERQAAVPRRAFVADRQACRSLVEALAGRPEDRRNEVPESRF